MGRAIQLDDLELASLRARLVRYARLLTRDAATAEDLVQETLLAVIEHRAEPRGDASVATWAVGILKHKVADWWRSRESHWLTNLEDADGDSDSPLDSLCHQCAHLEFCVSMTAEPDGMLERRELAAAIDRCVSRLSSTSARVFVLHECLGFETAEIGAQLGLTAQNCRMLLHRARMNLRKCLEREWRPSPGISTIRSSRSLAEARPTRRR